MGVRETSRQGNSVSLGNLAPSTIRVLIRARTGEGRKRVMANSVKFGRKRKLSDYQRQEAIKYRAFGETLASIAKSYARRHQHDFAAVILSVAGPSLCPALTQRSALVSRECRRLGG